MSNIIIRNFILCLSLLGYFQVFPQSQIISSETQNPISFATVSFQNGYGIIADEEGFFKFSSQLYPSVDSLYITALGFEDIKIGSTNIPSILKLNSKISELDEVLISVELPKNYKEITLDSYIDADYYNSWLPTIESEIAVFFENEDGSLRKLTQVHFPLTLESKDWNKRKRANAEKKPFSTLFKVKFYSNKDGFPDKNLANETIVFRVTEAMGDNFSLDVSAYNLLIPKTGFFASLQVLGYTDKNGKLLPNKKYKEIKSASGIVRIPTNFRPLLPFTSKMETDRTFIKRVFISGNTWVKFNKENVSDSSLLRMGLNNYGIGISYNIYKDD